jgi:glycogen debranching enzyme
VLDRLVLKENEVFAVTNGEGDIRAYSIDGQGLYYADTRFLSVFELAIDDIPLQALSATGELSFMNNFQFANLPVTLPNGRAVQARTLSLRRNRFIDSGLNERLGIQNYGPDPLSLRLRLVFGSDFRDMFDVRGYARRPQRGKVSPPTFDGQEILLRYIGLDHVERSTCIWFDTPPSRVEMDAVPPPQVIERRTEGTDGIPDPRTEEGPAPMVAMAIFDVDLEPGAVWTLALHVEPSIGSAATEAEELSPAPSPSIDSSFQRVLREHEQWEESSTRITTDHALLNMLMQRSLHDLRLTINHLPTGLMPVAGIPWFAVPFGRDSIITSLEALCLNPDIAYGTLRFLAKHQGDEVDLWRDEEPGKILHEIRSGEMAALREVPQTPYYGSVDSTPLFVCLFVELLRWTNDWALAEELRPSLDAALEWLETYGDQDGDGLIEYESHSTGGIHNQGWKDSFDSIQFPDRRLAEAPIAVVEVQAYAYAAEKQMAEIYQRMGDTGRATRYAAAAARRKQRFERAFWMEDESFYAIALDAHKKPVPSIASNPGHCFFGGLLDGKRADAVAARLMLPDMRSGWGIRTLSSAYPTFNPMSYHNGSIWPHDNGIIAAGLRRCGYDDEALHVIDEVLNAGFRLPGYRMPELFCGFSRDLRYQSAPASYPVSCSPQAWAAGSVFLMLQHLLGIEPDLPNNRVTIRPRLLPWLNELRFENMRLGARRANIRVWREDDTVACQVSGMEDIEVAITLPTSS